MPNRTRWVFVDFSAEQGSELWVTDGIGAPARLLADIRTGSGGSTPSDFTTLTDGRLMFVAENIPNGRELWITDGTASGTHLLKDIHASFPWSYPVDLTLLSDGKVLFTAEDGTDGRALWISDGTETGTHRVKAFNVAEPEITGLTALPGGRAVFRAHDSAHGNEVWVTDGTESGTHLVKDIAAGNAGSQVPAGGGGTFHLLPDGRALFSADDGDHGALLWVTDGTEAGTHPVKDFATGILSPDGFFQLADGRYMFSATFWFGSQLWITDGTDAGSKVVKDFGTGSLGVDPASFAQLPGGAITFVSNDLSSGIGAELWITDGSPAGTRLVKDIAPGASSSAPSGGIVLGDGRLLFRADDGVHGNELWTSDGTDAGTHLLKDIASGPGGSSSDAAQDILIGLPDGRALFTAYDNVHGYELWVSDGSEPGTQMLADIWPGQGSGTPSDFSLLADGRYAFLASDPTHGLQRWVTDGTPAGTVPWFDGGNPAGNADPASLTRLPDGRVLFAATSTNGRELWITDGTAPGTWLVQDIAHGSGGSEPDTGYGLSVLPDGRALFTDSQHTLWVTDGSESGTQRLKDIAPAASAAAILPNGRALLFASDPTHGDELWITDGTASGTQLVKDINTGADGSGQPQGRNFVPLPGGRFLFAANDGTHGSELWVTDGTGAGTQRVGDIRPGGDSSSPEIYALLPNGQALLVANDGTHGAELWSTDGTEAGTRLVSDIAAGPEGSSAGNFKILPDGRVLFTAQDTTHGLELWVTRGTPDTTALVADINPGGDALTGWASSFAANFMDLPNGNVLFTADDGAHGREIWVTNGAASGTQLVKDIQSGLASPEASNFTALPNGLILFAASDGVLGTELWITDATETGTRPLLDIREGAGSSSPANLTALPDGRVLFTANDFAHGTELWITDGTASGTQMVKDIATGSSSSSPAGLYTLPDGRVMFSADDGLHGNELWITDGSEAGTRLVRDIAQSVPQGSLGLYRAPLVNEAPTAGNATLNATEDTPLSSMLPPAIDVDGDTVTYATAANAAHGNVTVDAAGHYTYTPQANFQGTDSFRYAVSDGLGGTNAYPVDITVAPVNDAPTLAHAIGGQLASEGSPFSFTVPDGTFADVDPGDALTYQALLTGSQLLPPWLTFDVATHTFSGTPGQEQVGSISIQVTATDNGDMSVSDTFSLTVAPINHAPESINALADTREDTTLTGTLPPAVDIDGNTVHYARASDPFHGSVTVAANGSFVYTPDANFNGPDLFQFAVVDNLGASNIYTAAITVLPVNDPPSGQITINGMPATTSTLVASQTLGDADGLGPFTYQWFADDTPIANANEQAFLISAAQAGKALSVRLSYTDGNGTLEVVNSTPTANVVNLVNGTDGPDVLNGIAGADWILGLAGNDTIRGFGGNDTVDGGEGVDTFVLGITTGDLLTHPDELLYTPGTISQFGSSLGRVDLLDIERVKLSDGYYAFDTLAPSELGAGGKVWQAAALYRCGFGHMPGIADLSFWTAKADASANMAQLGQEFIDHYAPGIANDALVSYLYHTLTGQTAPAEVVDVYAIQIGAGQFWASQGALFAWAAGLPPNTDAMAGFTGSIQLLDGL